ncbi:helix-turn-helix domain-containing protein [Tenacibaculum sp. 1B UA]|uniref:helix-turn-helix domain-containing protein n=1 Tax=Tenacibaculum sp. 1B UA TaxID=2922252 RepID=UPI002A24DB92|nr:helix-turn-helix domain-containing protein [Tenacibaculum sp. 1B UA]MDX8555018.1 helix-turn-helix domain-containing protein [Tenacibaculum sp. 1B UA]
MSYLRKLFTLFFLFHVFYVLAQEQAKKFDSIFYNTAVRVSAIDIVKASKIADSLYKTSKTNIHKIKSLMLSADLLEKQSKRKKAIDYVLKADSILSNTENYEWKARVYGFLSTQYRILGLLDQGKEYLEKGLKASKKIQAINVSNQYRGMVYQEKAHYALHEKNYNEAIVLLKKVSPLFSSIKNERMKLFFFGNNEEMLGRSYLNLKKYNYAKQHYKKALTYLNKANAGESQWMGMVFYGLGKIALEFNKTKESLSYLLKAKNIAENINHVFLKKLVYSDLKKYYLKEEDFDKYTFYNTKYINSVKENIKLERETSNSEFNRVVKKQKTDFLRLSKIITIISTLFICSILFYLFTKRKNRKELEKYKAIIEKLNAFNEKLEPKNSPLLMVEKTGTKCLMPKQTENRLLTELEKFEDKKEFINSNISLSSLSTKLNTNTKYLSYIINTHKKKDFNNYINELRVFHFIKMVQTNPEFLNYKISYLSEKCGFSSHSKFTTVFKNIVGLTPSTFLKKERFQSNQPNN